MPLPRTSELRRRRNRRKKLAKLRKRFIVAKTKDQKTKILEKVSRIAPNVTL